MDGQAPSTRAARRAIFDDAVAILRRAGGEALEGAAGAGIATFGLLTNHAHVLLCVARDPDMRLRDIADCVGITERAAHRIVCELEEGGYVTRRRDGRRNVYEVHAERELPHPLEQGARVADLLKAVSAPATSP